MNVENISRFGRSFSIVRVPYALKLLIQELQVLNIQMRIITEDNIDQLMSMSYSDNINQLLKDDEPNIEKLVTSIISDVRRKNSTMVSKTVTIPKEVPEYPEPTQETVVSEEVSEESPEYIQTSPAYQPTKEEIEQVGEESSGEVYDLYQTRNAARGQQDKFALAPGVLQGMKPVEGEGENQVERQQPIQIQPTKTVIPSLSPREQELLQDMIKEEEVKKAKLEAERALNFQKQLKAEIEEKEKEKTSILTLPEENKESIVDESAEGESSLETKTIETSATETKKVVSFDVKE